MTINPASFLNETVKSIPPSGIRKFFDLVSQTKGVISLGVGEPDLVTLGILERPVIIPRKGLYHLYL